MTEQIAHLMKTLDISEAEAKQMIADDAEIDHGKDLFPLTAEQEKASKQARGTGTRAYTFTKRERKADNDKRELISFFDELLADVSDGEIVITNPERQIDFTYNDRHFRIVLSAPRTPSKWGGIFKIQNEYLYSPLAYLFIVQIAQKTWAEHSRSPRLRMLRISNFVHNVQFSLAKFVQFTNLTFSQNYGKI